MPRTIDRRRAARGADPRRALLLSALLVVALAGGRQTAAAAESGRDPLTDLGLQFEAARLDARLGDRTGAEAVARALAALDKDQVPAGRRAAAALLRGWAAREAGDPGAAAREYERAAKAADTEALRAAAEFLRIEAVEAGGEDAEATKRWVRWLRDHGTTSLAPEARLHQAWNDLRRGETRAAGGRIDQLVADEPWLADDPRCGVARAAVDYLSGDHVAALVRLERHGAGAGAMYLRALCQRAAGDHLRAAAAFQEVADRHPSSPLRDPALLAKANIFLEAGAYASAAEEFARTAAAVHDAAVAAEASLRRAACVLLAGDNEAAAALLREVVAAHAGTDVAARAQFLVAEAMVAAGAHEAAIVEYNRVLTSYFEQGVAASAQYRLGRCFDALGRPADATGAYQAVVSGYPLEPEAPAAAYLAGAGLLGLGRPRAAVPYFQLVLDRYASREDGDGSIVFASPEHQELVEASLCLLELSWHRAGELGQLAGATHVLLHKAPPSTSSWRAYALLIDADAMAAQGRYEDARASLESLFRDFPNHPTAAPATQLLAWTYAQQGEEDLAVRTAEQLLARWGAGGDARFVAGALLNVAHVRFNQGRYGEAATAYEEFLARYPGHAQHTLALYQSGLCYLRLDRGGDAVDRWEALVAAAPDAPIAERAWARAGDLYFQAEDYGRAKRSYQGLLDNFAGSQAAAMGLLRVAQCEYNAGKDAEALAGYAAVIDAYPSTPLADEATRGMEAALYRLGQGAGGVAQLAELVEKYPDGAFAADAQFRIASRLYEQEDFAAAAEEFRRVVSRFPSYSAADRAQFLMGDAWSRAGRDDEARRAFEQFLVFFGDSELRTTVRFRLGVICFAEDDYIRAATNFTDVLDRQPDAETARASLYNLALCKRLLGDADGAAADFERYRGTYPGDERAAAVAFQIADIHDAAGRTGPAVASLEEAAAAAPAEPLRTEIWYRLGACREKQADVAGALAAYAKAAKAKDRADPFRLSAVARAATLHEQNEDYKQALAAYRDLMNNAQDPELRLAASGRASELAAAIE